MGRALRSVSLAVIAVAFGLPLVMGVLGTLGTAIGWFPNSLPGLTVLSDPRLFAATRLTLFTGLMATALALVLCILTLMVFWGRGSLKRIQQALAPFLAVPHAALAVGLVFVLAPSGWLARLVTLEGRPSEAWIAPDPEGWSLILGLALKEFPFLLMTALAYLPRLSPDEFLRQGRVLGYRATQCWVRLILPNLLHAMRLPVAVVLAYNLSVVDMAIILGPGQPPTLAVWVIEYFVQPGGRAQASVAALWLLLVMAVGFLIANEIYRMCGHVTREFRTDSQRKPPRPGWGHAGRAGVMGLLGLATLALVSLWIFSFSHRWRFPDALPERWTLRFWQGRWDDWAPLVENTLSLGMASALLALLAAVIWLEAERAGRIPRLDGLWYLPLFIPQACVLLGWQAGALVGGVDGAWGTLVWAHWVYALPYVLLVLAPAWRSLDVGYERQARLLGASPWGSLIRVRMPLLLRPLLIGWAVAMAVSIAQYLPTLLLGAGRYPTLTTELVTSFGGVDRRVIGTLASLQMLLPWLVFAIALALPAWVFRNRRHA